MPLFGTPVLRTEDPRLLRGASCFVADLDLPGVAHVAYVTSTAAHARIVNVRVDAAIRAPGVLTVVTAADLELAPYPAIDASLSPVLRRPLLATGTVRFVGEPIVAIVAESRAAAEDAAELVEIDFDPLRPVVGIADALTDEVLLFPELGSNVVACATGGRGDVEPEACEVVVRATFESARVAPCPLEGRAGAARWDEDGRLTVWLACQGPQEIRSMVSDFYGLDPARVRVVAPDVGGSFGAKRSYPEDLLLPWLAARVGRPVWWFAERSTDMVGLGHSRRQRQEVVLGGRRDGTIEAMRVEVTGDAGAYPVLGQGLARSAATVSPGAYAIPSVHWKIRAVVTTTTPIVAYRGAGRPEAAAIIERAIELFAAEVDLDPVTVRRRNFLRPEQFPYVSPTELHYDSGEYEKVLDAALAASGYDALRAEQQRRRADGHARQLGIGLATFIDRTGALVRDDFAELQLRDDGSLRLLCGSNPYGQGHHTTWAMLVADRTGVPMERIEVVHGDTDVVPRGSLTGGSRSAHKQGTAVAVAAQGLVEQARAAAAELLEASVDDVVLDVETGRFHVAGSPSSAIGWCDLAAAGSGVSGGGEPRGQLRCEGGPPKGPGSNPFGAYVAVVEVDVETGHVRLDRLVTVDDAGCIINPLLALGQVHGGAAQGVAQALLEEFVFDADGNPLTATFADYPVISAAELPSFECLLIETPSPTNPLGAKGIGENGTIGAPVAVQNAVIDALRPYGATHLDMPCTPERVWRAMHGVR